MKILALRFNDGSVSLIDAPAPALLPGSIRVRTLWSAVSPGTEGNKIVTGQKSLLGKAKARPDQVRQVLDMVRSVGLKATIQKVRSKLEGAQGLGYSLCGEVVEVAPGVSRFAPGDLAACGGVYANHADEAVVPENLAAKVPPGVAAEDAAMATLGAIAMQGVRLAQPTLGENAVVIGLGVIGLMAGQLLRANGCRVLGADISPEAVALALRSGSVDAGAMLSSDPIEAQVAELSRGPGADMVLICAGTASNEPIELAGRLARKKGRVVVVGAVGLNVPREDYYLKELSLQISCSYGPGRYDASYEEQGVDYPYAYVRWTEGRNLEAFLDLTAAGRIAPATLVTHRFPFAQAPGAYELIARRSEPYAGILLEYPHKARQAPAPIVLKSAAAASAGTVGIGFIGAGSYAQAFLLPPLKARGDVRLTSIFTRTGLSAADVGHRFGFARAVGSLDEVLGDPDTQAVVVATRHDQHAPAVLAALNAGKHVFVEKPLCLTIDELKEIVRLARELAVAGRLPVLQVGYNRRFSPSARAAKRHFGQGAGPLTMMYRVNAGVLPREHWTQDPREGGGRILGEVCHFVDLMQFMCGADPTEVHAAAIETGSTADVPADNSLLTLRFGDGSVGTIGYFAHGAKSLPKERLEVHAAGRTAVLDNYTSLELYSARGKRRQASGGKGQTEELAAFLEAIKTGAPAIPLASLICTSLATLGMRQSALTHLPVRLDPAGPGLA